MPEDQLPPEPIIGPVITEPHQVRQSAPPIQHVRPLEIFSWSAPNRVFDPKSPIWFLGVFAIALLLIIVFAVLREFWLIMLVGAVVFVLYALHRVEPGLTGYRILNVGIEAGGRLYSWKDLQSFWIFDRDGQNLLKVETKLHFPHVLELLLPDGFDKADIEQTLTQHLSQIEKPVSENGAMFDSAAVSIGGMLPYREKLLGWLDKRLKIREPDQS